jgi:hypothetical protein
LDRPFSSVHPVILPARWKLFLGRWTVLKLCMGGGFQKSAADFCLALTKAIVVVSGGKPYPEETTCDEEALLVE